jgi:hypothetical protein
MNPGISFRGGDRGQRPGYKHARVISILQQFHAGQSF